MANRKTLDCSINRDILTRYDLCFRPIWQTQLFSLPAPEQMGSTTQTTMPAVPAPLPL